MADVIPADGTPGRDAVSRRRGVDIAGDPPWLAPMRVLSQDTRNRSKVKLKQ